MGWDVGVDEPGVEHPARQIDHRGFRPAPCAQVGVDRRDAPVHHRDLEALGNDGAARAPVDDPSDEEEVCRGHGPHARNGYAEVFALTSYDVFVDSKKLTSCRVSFAVAIHFAGFDTLYSGSKPSSSRRRSARYFTYWLM